jgi:hypothetical protein
MSAMPPYNPEQLNAEVARAREAELEQRAERYSELHGNDEPMPGLFARIRARLRGRSGSGTPKEE